MGLRHGQLRSLLLLTIGLIVVGAVSAGCGSQDAPPTLAAPSGPALVMFYTDN